MTEDTAADGRVDEDAASGGELRDHPQFLRLWAGQASGAVGDQVFPVALSLYVLHEGGGAAQVGLVLGVRAVALVVCLLVGGVIADRLRRTRVLIGGRPHRLVHGGR